jgi:hypothetical protein
MPKPRQQQVSLSDTPYCHCVTCCAHRFIESARDKALLRFVNDDGRLVAVSGC